VQSQAWIWVAVFGVVGCLVTLWYLVDLWPVSRVVIGLTIGVLRVTFSSACEQQFNGMFAAARSKWLAKEILTDSSRSRSNASSRNRHGSMPRSVS